jgi:hypothetical protein
MTRQYPLTVSQLLGDKTAGPHPFVMVTFSLKALVIDAPTASESRTNERALKISPGCHCIALVSKCD